jgi:hypothetical protein
MERPTETINRLVGALELLLQDCHFLFSAQQFVEAEQTLSRCEPLVKEIVSLAAVPEVRASLEATLKPRVNRILAQQAELITALDEAKKEVKAQLKDLTSASTRSAQMRATYGKA